MMQTRRGRAMRGVLVGISVASALVRGGCSTNRIELENQSGSSVTFVFRGEQYSVSQGASRNIEDIPNGSFEYGTDYKPPARAQSSSEEGPLSGTLTFQKDQTDYVFFYGSKELSGKYVLTLAISSSNRVGDL